MSGESVTEEQAKIHYNKLVVIQNTTQGRFMTQQMMETKFTVKLLTPTDSKLTPEMLELFYETLNKATAQAIDLLPRMDLGYLIQKEETLQQVTIEQVF